MTRQADDRFPRILTGTELRQASAASDRLVVTLHGWVPQLAHYLDDVEAAVVEALPGADLLSIRYPGGYFSCADPVEVSEAISEAIEAALADRRARGGEYATVTVVGFSCGAMLARKAIAIARGQTQDRTTLFPPKPSKWALRIDRVILLAGMNRGWSLAPRPRHMPAWFYWGARGMNFLTRHLGACKFVRAFERGAPFIVNLRIQWLNLERSGTPLPATIQFLGDRDDVVTEEDSVDLQVCSRFNFIKLKNTDHAASIRLDDTTEGRRRRALLRLALSGSDADMKEASETLPAPDREFEAQGQRVGDANASSATAPVTDVLYVVHGIRDFGSWTGGVRQAAGRLVDESNAATPGAKRSVFVVTSRYDRFPMGAFLLTSARARRARWFADLHTQMTARFPGAQHHFIGHSNGTYLLSRALIDYRAITFENIAFAGSVVRRSYPWDEMVAKGRIRRLRNDLASRDWVVAVFPRVFEMLEEVLKIRTTDVGSGGVGGFENTEGNRNELPFLDGGHGIAIDAKNHASLARFALGLDTGSAPDSAIARTQSLSSPVAILSAFCWAVWLGLLCLPVVAALGLNYLWYWRWAASAAPWAEWISTLPAPWLPVVVPIVVTVALFVWLLETV